MINTLSSPVAPEANVKTIILKDFSAGWVDKFPADAIPDKAICDGQNMYFKEGPALTTRFGYSRYNANEISGSSGIRGVFGFNPSNSSNRWVVVASGAKLYYANNGNFSEISGATGYAANANWVAVQFANALYLVNGTNSVRISESGGALTATPSTSVPAGTMLVEHKNMLFTSGVTGFPNRLYFSPIGDADGTWPPANVIEIVSNDGDPVTTLAPLEEYLTIFKKNSVFALEGASASSFFLRRISTDYGCSGPRAASVVGENIAFFDVKGPRAVLLKKSYAFEDISTDKIPNAFYGLNDTKLHLVAVSSYLNLIIFNVAQGSSLVNDTRLVYDLDRKAWFPKVTGGFSCEYLYDAGTAYVYYSGNPADGFLYTQNTSYKDDTETIAAKVRTKDFDLGLPFNRKKVRKLWARVGFSNSQLIRRVTATPYIDGGAGSSTVFDFGGSSAPIIKDLGEADPLIIPFTFTYDAPSTQRERAAGKGRTVGFQIENLTTDQGFTLYALEFPVKIRPIK